MADAATNRIQWTGHLGSVPESKIGEESVRGKANTRRSPETTTATVTGWPDKGTDGPQPRRQLEVRAQSKGDWRQFVGAACGLQGQ